MRPKKDIKFIIYQSLYIFVICVIAIKGANIDLVEVDAKKMIDPGWTYVDTTNKILIDRNDLTKLIKFDSTKYLIVSKEDYNRNPEKYAGLQVINTHTGDYTQPLTGNLTIEKTVTQEEPVKDKEIVIGNIELYQYHSNPVPNQGNNPITISGTTIPAHSTGKVTLGGESSVIVSAGDVKRTVNVKENRKPQVSFARISSMGEDAKVTTLQRNVCYRITVSDDFVEQLDVKFSGGVTVKQVGPGIYDVTMNSFGSKAAFDNYTDSRTSPYSVGFTVTVSDRIAPHKVTGQNSFIFGEW